jgi:hypothetical protein
MRPGTGPDPNVRDWFVDAMVEDVETICNKEEFYPNRERLLRWVNHWIDKIVDEWAKIYFDAHREELIEECDNDDTSLESSYT